MLLSVARNATPNFPFHKLSADEIYKPENLLVLYRSPECLGYGEIIKKHVN